MEHMLYRSCINDSSGISMAKGVTLIKFEHKRQSETISTHIYTFRE